MSERFFVLHLDERDHHPTAEARYEIQILDTEGRAEYSVYVDSGGRWLTLEENESPPASSPRVPAAVLEAAMRQPKGQGDYVDVMGKSVPPF